MRVRIDQDLCSGHGRCWTLAPDVYVSDPDGYGQVAEAEVPEGLQAQARIGQQNCPERAIVIEE